MTAVILSRKLSLEMPHHEAVSLVQEFQLWRDGGIGPGDTFGKDTAFMKPKSVVDLGLRKVHLETPNVTPRWNYLIETEKVEDPQAFTSDKILVYGQLGYMRRAPYLLLTILEPGHLQMESPELVKGLGIFYESEQAAIGKYFPDNEWISTGYD
ncbi:hypothetical protein EGM97_09100 [Pseudomonas sp. AF32]|uniref:type II toxin-antitoxin system YafO family toxin n=1 Tax=Pseudomonas sp. AF32 TaxID=554390 RepID=UPI001EEE25F3|nr:type II toxin-antitoxin system YafO family toxin [Pseudomonas sp. AF32]MCG6574863.1 hypothetical protein [Pseudomonas sp. AF32]